MVEAKPEERTDGEIRTGVTGTRDCSRNCSMLDYSKNTGKEILSLSCHSITQEDGKLCSRGLK